jgi:hypothetical protein
VVIHIVSIVASSHFKIVLSSSVNGRALKKETQAKLYENAHHGNDASGNSGVKIL